MSTMEKILPIIAAELIKLEGIILTEINKLQKSKYCGAIEVAQQVRTLTLRT